MRSTARFFAIFLAILALLAQSPGVSQAQTAVAPPAAYGSAAGPMGWEAWLDQLIASRVDVVFLGEKHDNEHHHHWQARAVAGLEARLGAGGGVAGLVFEMIPQEREAEALEARGWPGAASLEQSRAVGEAVDWAASGWPDWSLYAPIVEASRGAYLAGGGYPRAALMRAASDGDWLSREPAAAQFGLDKPLPNTEQAQRESAQIASHCNAIPAEIAPMMVAAQRARDGRLAAAVLRARRAARAQGRHGPIVVIAGAGHARRDFGAPALLSHAAPDLKIAVSAFIETTDEKALNDDDENAALFDFRFPTPAPTAAREDPCAAFGATKASDK